MSASGWTTSFLIVIGYVEREACYFRGDREYRGLQGGDVSSFVGEGGSGSKGDHDAHGQGVYYTVDDGNTDKEPDCGGFL